MYSSFKLKNKHKHIKIELIFCFTVKHYSTKMDLIRLAETYESIGKTLNPVYGSCCFTIARQKLLAGNLAEYNVWNTKYKKWIEYKIDHNDYSISSLNALPDALKRMKDKL